VGYDAIRAAKERGDIHDSGAAGFLIDGGTQSKPFVLYWLPPRDLNPDMLIQSQLSCH
jgi:hypothetical protein